jgi:hypothetical protein
LGKLARLRQRVSRFKAIGQTLNRYYSPTTGIDCHRLGSMREA